MENDQFGAFEATINGSETHLYSRPALMRWLPHGARKGRWGDNLHVSKLCVFVMFFKLLELAQYILFIFSPKKPFYWAIIDMQKAV